MRHRIKGKKLKRTSWHKKAMMKNMMISLLKYERIKTTLSKAKELRRYIEPIITRAKIENLHNKRIILGKIHNRKLLVKLFQDIAPRFLKRMGGYTRIIRLSALRAGDNSKMALIELLEKDLEKENISEEKSK